MSTDVYSAPFQTSALRRDAHDPLIVFVWHAHSVARSADPMLAGLLAAILIGHHAQEDGQEWRGDRREGLELCRRLLLYVRHDVADRRIDVSLGYIAGELAAIGSSQTARAAH